MDNDVLLVFYERQIKDTVLKKEYGVRVTKAMTDNLTRCIIFFFGKIVA